MMTNPKTKAVTQSLRKSVFLGGTLLATGLAANNEVAASSELIKEIATSLGVGLPAFCSAVGAVGSVIGNKASDALKDLEDCLGTYANHDLEKAMEEAIRESLHALEKAFLEQYACSATEKRQLKRLFESLVRNLIPENLTEELLDTYVHDRANFALKLMDHRPISDAGISDALMGSVTTFLAAHLEGALTQGFLSVIKDQPRVQAAYFTFLLEQSLRNGKHTGEQLAVLHEAAQQLARQNNLTEYLLRQLSEVAGDVQNRLRKLQYFFAEAETRRREFDTLVRDQLQPASYLPAVAAGNEPGQQFHYQFRYTTFIGRETEMLQLWAFFRHDPQRRFVWWMVTGPGGMGKSRLAMEFCREAERLECFARFLQENEVRQFNWGNWQPPHPTLLVIDYALAQADDVAKMLIALSLRTDLKQRVRILLLDREVREDWWNRISANPACQCCAYAHPDDYRRTLTLPTFTEYRWQIIEEVHHKEKKRLGADRTETLAKLDELDPLQRPLFAFFVGMALAVGKDIRHWNVNHLLDHLLNRIEQNVWRKHKNWETQGDTHKNLLALITLTRGLTEAQVYQVYQQSPSWLHGSTEPKEEMYQWFAGIGEETKNDETEEQETIKNYQPLQPDLLGEYFVLQTLKKLKKEFLGEQKVGNFLQTAWDTGPKGTWWMTWMMLNDFYRQSSDKSVFKPLLAARPSAAGSEVAWYAWSILRYNLAHPDAAFTNSTQKWVYVQELDNASEKGSVNFIDTVLIQKTQALKNLAAKLSGEQVWQQGRQLLAEFEGLLEKTATTATVDAILIQNAQTLFNLGNRLSGEQVWQQGQQLLAEFEGLLEKTATTATVDAIFVIKAQALFNLGNRLSGEQVWQQGQQLLAEFEGLLEKTATTATVDAIFVIKAQALKNLSAELSGEQAWQQGQQLLAEFEGLLNKTTTTATVDVVAIEKAKALKNLAAKLSGEQAWQQGQQLLAEFEGLLEKTVTTATVDAIAIEKAQALFNLGNRLSGEQAWQQGQQLLAEFEGLLNKTATTATVDAILILNAQALFNLSIKLNGKQAWQQGQQLLSEFEGLLEKTVTAATVDAITIEKAKALKNLFIRHLSNHRETQADADAEAVKVCLRLLEALLNQYPSPHIFEVYCEVILFHPFQVPETRAQAALWLLREYTPRWFEAKDDARTALLNKMNIYIQQLSGLANRTPETPSVQEAYWESLVIFPVITSGEDARAKASAAFLLFQRFKQRFWEKDQSEENLLGRMEQLVGALENLAELFPDSEYLRQGYLAAQLALPGATTGDRIQKKALAALDFMEIYRSQHQVASDEEKPDIEQELHRLREYLQQLADAHTTDEMRSLAAAAVQLAKPLE